MQRNSVGMGSTGSWAAAVNAPAARGQRWRIAGAFLVAAFLTSCGDDGRTPTSPPPPGGGGGTAPVSTTRIVLDGPTTVALGKTAQFTVIAHQSDGTTRDVTGDATWRVFSPDVLSVEGRGQLAGKGKGQTSVTVSWAGRSATIATVIVVPEGTYRLVGTIRDGGATVQQAEVRIDNAAFGVLRIPAVNGTYAVFGVVGETQVTVTKDGYVETGKRLVVSQHERVDIDLPLVNPRPQLAAHYTVNITAADGCGLPSELRQRSYSAKIEQLGPQLIVTLLQGRFQSGYYGGTQNVFNGVLEGNDVTFNLSSMTSYGFWYYYLPSVLEILDTRSYYTFDGKITARLDGTSIIGTLDGSISEMSGPPYRYGSRCVSDHHAFRMTR